MLLVILRKPTLHIGVWQIKEQNAINFFEMILPVRERFYIVGQMLQRVTAEYVIILLIRQVVSIVSVIDNEIDGSCSMEYLSIKTSNIETVSFTEKFCKWLDERAGTSSPHIGWILFAFAIRLKKCSHLNLLCARLLEVYHTYIKCQF